MVKNKKINTIEAKLNRTKPLEEIEEQIETLKRKIEEDRHIMNDKKSSTELKQAAAVRFSEKKKNRRSGLIGVTESRKERSASYA